MENYNDFNKKVHEITFTFELAMEDLCALKKIHISLVFLLEALTADSGWFAWMIEAWDEQSRCEFQQGNAA